mmetsp:Transcript_60324/g.166995  ORF Transcript_60324/g.166995 Transcript_60324/m.166995 type:complete len:247 (-) Transcript_60324:170-910(-)
MPRRSAYSWLSWSRRRRRPWKCRLPRKRHSPHPPMASKRQHVPPPAAPAAAPVATALSPPRQCRKLQCPLSRTDVCSQPTPRHRWLGTKSWRFPIRAMRKGMMTRVCSWLALQPRWSAPRGHRGPQWYWPQRPQARPQRSHPWWGSAAAPLRPRQCLKLRRLSRPTSPSTTALPTTAGRRTAARASQATVGRRWTDWPSGGTSRTRSAHFQQCRSRLPGRRLQKTSRTRSGLRWGTSTSQQVRTAR